jgi:hypothetical protein
MILLFTLQLHTMALLTVKDIVEFSPNYDPLVGSNEGSSCQSW